jgi:monoamine oxidase
MTPNRRTFLAGAAASVAAFKTLPAFARTAADADVIVIGAGLSGLHAASLLESEGARVTILEGRTRVGGRIFTLDDVPGHPEAGGNGIGAGYARVLDAAKTSGVKTIPVRQRTESTQANTLINLGGTNVQLSEWKDSPLKPVPAGTAREAAMGISGRLLPESQSTEGDGFLARPKVREVGYLALRLPEEPGSERSRHGSRALYRHALWHQPLRLFASCHVPHALLGRPAAELRQGGLCDRRREPAPARSDGRQAQERAPAGKTIYGIRTGPDGVQVVTSDGKVHRARFAIVTVPFSALRSVRFDPVLPALQAEAIDLLGYATGFQTHFVAKRPFWLEDGLPANMWTDGPPAALQRFTMTRIRPRSPRSSPS